ncbi:CRTAC1 family protein [Marinicella sp. W31]|uniref:CRTAC1 family protein n=1 Tax=Marinicella sp. W31 TaxID=3023713 RepID=UPI003757EFDA
MFFSLAIFITLASVNSGKPPVWHFVDNTETVGLNFNHQHDTDFDLINALKFISGLAIGDVNGDGLDDIFATTGSNLDTLGVNQNPNKLFIANGDGSYTESAAIYGINQQDYFSSGSLIADFDGDGWRDLIIGGVHASEDSTYQRIRLYRNQMGKGFLDVTQQSGLPQINTYNFSAGDMDADGDLDLAIAQWRGGDSQILWRNNGQGQFTDVTQSWLPGLPHEYTFTPVFAHINPDRHVDFMLISDFGESKHFLHTGSGFSLQDSTALTDQNGMGAAIGDYDNDGDFDWFVTSIYRAGAWNDGNRLYRNDGAGQWTDVTETAGVRNGDWGWGTCFADFNNDGLLDLYQVNGHPIVNYFFDPARLFINQGDGTFTEQANLRGVDDTGMGKAVLCYDNDQDGDMDLMINNFDGASRFFENQLSDENNYVKIKLTGVAGNGDAIGARIHILAGQLQQSRQIMAGANYASGLQLVQHFGLADAELIERIQISWPGGHTSTHCNQPVNQLLHFQQPEVIFKNDFELNQSEQTKVKHTEEIC